MFETGFYYVVQVSLQLGIRLPWPPKCWVTGVCHHAHPEQLVRAETLGGTQVFLQGAGTKKQKQAGWNRAHVGWPGVPWQSSGTLLVHRNITGAWADEHHPILWMWKLRPAERIYQEHHHKGRERI